MFLNTIRRQHKEPQQQLSRQEGGVVWRGLALTKSFVVSPYPRNQGF
jgi:hypothetical protein